MCLSLDARKDCNHGLNHIPISFCPALHLTWQLRALLPQHWANPFIAFQMVEKCVEIPLNEIIRDTFKVWSPKYLSVFSQSLLILVLILLLALNIRDRKCVSPNVQFNNYFQFKHPRLRSYSLLIWNIQYNKWFFERDISSSTRVISSTVSKSANISLIEHKVSLEDFPASLVIQYKV